MKQKKSPEVKKKARKKTKSQEFYNLLLNLIEKSSDAIFIVDKDNNIKFASSACEQIFGYTPEEFVNDPELTPRIVHPECRERFQKFWEDFNTTKKFPEGATEWRWIKKDGTVVYTENSFSNIYDKKGKVIGFVTIARDITHRKKAEEKLREKDAYYSALLKNALDFTSVLDEEGRILFHTATVRGFLGYSENELQGKSIFEYIHPEDYQSVKDGFTEVISEYGKIVTREFRFKHRNGTYRWIESTGYNLLGDPVVKGVVVNSRDIHDRKCLENELKKREALFRGMIENTNEIFTIIDKNGQMIYFTPTLEKIMGFKPEEITNRNAFDFVHPEDAVILGDAIRQVLAKPGNVVTRQVRMKHKDGSWRYIESTGYNLLHDPAVQGIVINSRDITEQKELEQAILESESKFRKLVENAIVGVNIIQDGKIVYANSKSAEIFGYTVSEMVGTPVYEFVMEEDRDLVMENIRKRIAGEIEGINYQFRGRRKDGSIIQIEAYGSRTDFKGKPAVIGMIIDITERKRLEEQLFQSQKLEAVGRLAGGIAHDFNNLLTLIMLHSEVILKQLGENSDVSASIKEIYESAQRASNLTAQLLSFARRRIIEPVVFNVNTLIKGINNMLKSLIGEHIKTEIILDENLHPVKVDPAQLEHSIINLVLNARDAMPSGGKLIIETQNVYLDQNYARTHQEVTPGEYVLIAVSDTGVGMDENIKSRIFEPFFTTKPAGKGTGLGLASVYGFVKQSGGHIWVYSEKGRGTTFKIYLPVYKEVSEAMKLDKKEPVELHGKETILFAEDEYSIRELITKILTSYGYKVIEARDGVEALEKAKGYQGDIHLLVTDLVMPRLGGKDLYSELKKERPQVEALFISGYTDNVIIHNFIIEEGVNFLQKPFKPEALLKKIRSILDKNK